MALITCNECGKYFSDKASNCPHCGCPTIEAIMNSSHSFVPGERAELAFITDQKAEKLRDYLEHARILENDIYTFDTIVDGLNKQLVVFGDTPDTTKIPVGDRVVLVPPVAPEAPSAVNKPEKPTILMEEKSKTVKSYAHICLAATIFCVLLAAISGVGFFALICAFTFYACPVLYLRARSIEKQEDAARGPYESAVCNYEKYLEAVNSHEKKLAEYNVALSKYEREKADAVIFNQSLCKSIADTEAKRAETRQALHKLYDQGVIYPKYRGIVPVTMFCEYMDSKRRTALEGKNGMYDLYETELLGKTIVGEIKTVNKNLAKLGDKLDLISHNLNSMQRNQRLLYEAVAQGNAIAGRISKEVSSQQQTMLAMSSSINKIQQSAELTAFNSAATKRSTEVLERIATQKYSDLRY